jgi:hypothetical protein
MNDVAQRSPWGVASTRWPEDTCGAAEMNRAGPREARRKRRPAFVCCWLAIACALVGGCGTTITRGYGLKRGMSNREALDVLRGRFGHFPFALEYLNEGGYSYYYSELGTQVDILKNALANQVSVGESSSGPHRINFRDVTEIRLIQDFTLPFKRLWLLGANGGVLDNGMTFHPNFGAGARLTLSQDLPEILSALLTLCPNVK